MKTMKYVYNIFEVFELYLWDSLKHLLVLNVVYKSIKIKLNFDRMRRRGEELASKQSENRNNVNCVPFL
jgi:hypothetical protein